MWLEKFQFHLFEKKPVNDQHMMYMRNACFKALVLVLAMFGVASTAVQSHAQTIETLVQFTNNWRYNATGTNLGTAWRSNTFSDAAWPQGRAMIGYEPDAASIVNYNTAMGITPTSTPFNTPLPQLTTVTTLYFRTTFNFSGSLAGVSLIASNLVDDSLVIHLNGAEVGRLRVPAGQTATTQASGSAATEGANEPITLANLGTALKVGQNLLAVEVHGAVSGTYDSAFGMKLIAIRPTTLVITNQPDSLTVSVGDPVTFTVGVSGGPAVYRWQKDGVNLASTSNTLVIASAQVASAGDYQVFITNAVSSLASAVAVLTVTADTDGPKVTEAIVDNGFGTNSVNIKFDENLTTATARNTNNYRLVPVSNTNISIRVTNILYSSALGALLQVSTTDANWNPRGQYFVVINGVADSKGNNIAPYTRVPVSIQITTNLTQMSDKWFENHLLWADPTIYDNTSPSTSWFGTNYVVDLGAGLWTDGGIGGIYYFDPDTTGQVCAGDDFGELIGFQNDPTLFRRTFTLPAGLGTNGVFRFRYIIDDGMVLYLNGAEIHRYNMPAGAVTSSSKALADQNPATCVTNVTIPVKNLRAGTNVLAAAVHQSAAANSDTIFGLEMDAVFLSTPVMPIQEPPTNQLKLSYSYTKAARQLVMSWPTNFSGFSLVSKSAIGTNDSKPEWIQVSDQTNPYTNSIPTNSNRFFEVKKL